MMKAAILEHHLKSASVRHNPARILQQARDTIHVSKYALAIRDLYPDSTCSIFLPFNQKRKN